MTVEMIDVDARAAALAWASAESCETHRMKRSEAYRFGRDLFNGRDRCERIAVIKRGATSPEFYSHTVKVVIGDPGDWPAEITLRSEIGDLETLDFDEIEAITIEWSDRTTDTYA